MSGKKVLVVEDHDDTRRALVSLLGRLGYQVVEAATVAQGIASVDGQAVAILDLNLPDGVGTEVLKHIRSQNHHTKVVCVTASADPGMLKELAALGPDAVFKKPVDVAQLLNWIGEPT